jgi:hypothetical protein
MRKSIFTKPTKNQCDLWNSGRPILTAALREGGYYSPWPAGNKSFVRASGRAKSLYRIRVYPKGVA